LTAASAVATLDVFEGAAMVPDATTATAVETSSVDVLRAVPVTAVEREDRP
jgi:hypothetical protein